MKKIIDVDFIGMCASLLCLVHCLCLPWLVAIAGVYFGAFFESPNFHNIMLVVAILIGLPVFILSFIRYRSKLILITGIVGLSLTTFGTIKSDNCCPAAGSEEVCTADSDCESKCESEGDCHDEDHEGKQAVENPKKNIVQSMNVVPLGVSLLIFAHFLNFRKRKSCKSECCN